MPRYATVLGVLLVLGMLAGSGCARAARDTTGFSVQEEATVQAPFEDAWQTVKGVLREQGYDIYTRDKRGAFVAYADAHRVLWTQPRRIKYTIDLAPVSDTETSVRVEAVRQVYGVTLLTYPGWHERRLTENDGAVALLAAVREKLSSAPAPAPAPAPAETEVVEASGDV